MTTAAELNELAATLAKAIADQARATTNFDNLVATEALKRANKLAVEYAKAADERIEQNAADLQRAQDLAAELRRQMAPLERIADQYADLVRRINALAGEAHRLGEGVPHAVLYAAITNARNAGYATTSPDVDQASAPAIPSRRT